MTRAFPKSVRNAVVERCDGICEAYRIPDRYGLPKQCASTGKEFDHIRPHYCGGTRDADNAAFLCVACHKLKSLIDNREAKKGNRIRKKANGETRQKQKIQSRPMLGTKASGFKKRMDGTVERRT